MTVEPCRVEGIRILCYGILGESFEDASGLVILEREVIVPDDGYDDSLIEYGAKLILVVC